MKDNRMQKYSSVKRFIKVLDFSVAVTAFLETSNIVLEIFEKEVFKSMKGEILQRF